MAEELLNTMVLDEIDPKTGKLVPIYDQLLNRLEKGFYKMAEENEALERQNENLKEQMKELEIEAAQRKQDNSAPPNIDAPSEVKAEMGQIERPKPRNLNEVTVPDLSDSLRNLIKDMANQFDTDKPDGLIQEDIFTVFHISGISKMKPFLELPSGAEDTMGDQSISMAVSPEHSSYIFGASTGNFFLSTPTSEGDISEGIFGSGIQAGGITAVAWIGDFSVIASKLGFIWLRDKEGEQQFEYEAQSGAVRDLAVHPSGKLLASVGADNYAVFYDIERKIITSKTPLSVGGFETPIVVVQINNCIEPLCATFSPGGGFLAIGRKDGSILHINLLTGFKVKDKSGAQGPIKSIGFFAYGKAITVLVEGNDEIQHKSMETGQWLTRPILMGFEDLRFATWDQAEKNLLVADSKEITVLNPRKLIVKDNGQDRLEYKWTVLLMHYIKAIAGAWGKGGESLILVNEVGSVTVLQGRLDR